MLASTIIILSSFLTCTTKLGMPPLQVVVVDESGLRYAVPCHSGHSTGRSYRHWDLIHATFMLLNARLWVGSMIILVFALKDFTV